MPFLRKRALVIRVAKDKDAPTSESDQSIIDNVQVVADYAEIAKDFITHAALTVGGVYVVCKIVGKICK